MTGRSGLPTGWTLGASTGSYSHRIRDRGELLLRSSSSMLTHLATRRRERRPMSDEGVRPERAASTHRPRDLTVRPSHHAHRRASRSRTSSSASTRSCAARIAYDPPVPAIARLGLFLASLALAGAIGCRPPRAGDLWGTARSAIRHDDLLVRSFAVLVLAESREEEGRRPFEALAGSPDVAVRVMVVQRMAVDGPQRHRDSLLRALREDRAVRPWALRAWYGVADPDVLRYAREAARASVVWDGTGTPPRPPVHLALYLASVGARDTGVMGPTMRRCADVGADEVEARLCGEASAAWWLHGAAEARGGVARALAHPSEWVRTAALDVLAVAPHDEACALAGGAASDPSALARISALGVLAKCLPRGIGAGEVRRALRDPAPFVRYKAALLLPTDDPAGTEVLVGLLRDLWLPDAAHIAAELARRDHPAGLARLERLVADPMRAESDRFGTLVQLFPIVDALSTLQGHRVEAMLRHLRGLRSLEGLTATLVLVRRGDCGVPPYFDEALHGERGLEAQLLADLIECERRRPSPSR